MSMKDSRDINTCGCCEESTPPTPEEIKNRPGLSAIRYRVGTYASFRQAMIEAIARQPELRDWTARTSDDYGIALLEMWAYLADILTFYQERIANEAFLRTALLRDSVLRLAALLDYEPAPGVAATASLAFTLEKDKQVKIPVGLRVQSVPGQDEKPQKFETIEALTATASLSRVRAFPEPTSVNPFEKGSKRAILKPSEAEAIANALSPGNDVLFFQTGHVADPKRGIEQKRVVSLETDTDGYKTLSWTPTMQKELPNTARAFKLVRVLHIFGHNAPRQYLKATPGTTKEPNIKTELKERAEAEYNVTIKKDTPFSLDTRYDDLKPGTKLLLHVKGGYLGVVTVDTVTQVQKSFPPLTDTITQITVTAPTYPNLFDRRKAVLYELADPEIVFWKNEFAGEIKAGSTTICVEAKGIASGDVKQGRSVILTDGSGTAELATVKSVAEVTHGGTKYLKITFKSALKHQFATTTAYLYGNVAKATHGETVADEVLGNGDASTEFQSFAIKKSPVTFVPRPGAPHGAANTLEVRAGGVLWHAVKSLYGRKSDERVYTTAVDDDDTMSVQFGDGVTGARLPSGRNNVVATYRQGLGREGNVKANTLTTLLDRPVGLKSMTNPGAAQGGADPESLEKARTNAPNTVRTFGRIVSLRDFEDAAREFAGVAKARATWVWDGEEQVVHLTVAGDRGAQVTGTTHKNLVADLDSRRDPNRKLVVATSYGKVPVEIEAVIKVHSDYVDETVRASAEKALQGYFAFDNLDLGQPIHLSDVYRVLQDVKGVVAVDINRLQFKNASDRQGHGATPEPVQSHLRIYPARVIGIDPVKIAPAELAIIESPATDVDITVSTG